MAASRSSRIRDLVHAALSVELLDRLVHLAAGERSTTALSAGSCCRTMSSSRASRDAGLLQLLIGSCPRPPPGAGGRRRRGVRGRAHRSRWRNSLHLRRAGQTRFVEHVEARGALVRRLAARQMALQRASTACRRRPASGPRVTSAPILRRRNRRARRRRGRPPGRWSCRHPRRLRARRAGPGWRGSGRTAVRWPSFRCGYAMLDVLARHAADERRVRLLAGAHHRDGVALQLDHLARREGASRRAGRWTARR